MTLEDLRRLGSREATFTIARGRRTTTVRGRLLAISKDGVKIVSRDHKHGDPPIGVLLDDIVGVEAIDADR